MTYGSTPPAITALYTGFVNGDTASSLTTKPTCSTHGHEREPGGAARPTPRRASGAVDPNYTITYVPGSVTVNKAPLTITASSGSMTYGGTPPAITAGYSGFKNGDSAVVADHTATMCSTTATSASPPSPPTYPSSCSGAVRSQLRHLVRRRRD